MHGNCIWLLLLLFRMRDGHLFCFASGNLPVNCLNIESIFGDLLGTPMSNGTLTVPMYKDLRKKHGKLGKDVNMDDFFTEALARRDKFDQKKEQKET